MTDRIIGCPHEESIDYGGPACRECPLSANRAGLGGLEPGQRVSVMVEQGARGLQATDVELI